MKQLLKNIFLHLPSFSIVFHRLPSSSIIFHHLPASSNIFQHLPSSSNIYQHLPSSSIIFHHLPSSSISFQHLPELARLPKSRLFSMLYLWLVKAWFRYHLAVIQLVISFSRRIPKPNLNIVSTKPKHGIKQT